jgi:4-amino-4-deoxy-L-arabinose transferase-like glycosyltransferase
VALAVGAGLVARVGLTTALFDWNEVATTSDDAIYAHLARTLLETGRLVSHHFPVGFPLFVALLLKGGGGSFAIIRVAHIVIGLLAIVVVSRIAHRLYGPRAGLVAAWMTALYPPLVYMTGRILSETLFIAILVLSLDRFLLGDRDDRAWPSALAGGLFALASLVRSNLVPMLPFVPLWPLSRPGAPLRARLGAAFLCLAVMGGILVLPGFYFLATTGVFIPFATNAGQTFYGANNPLADGGWVQVEDHPELLKSVPASVRTSATAYSQAQFRLGLQWIRANPGPFLRLLPRKFGNAWIPGFHQSETTSGSRVASLVFSLSAGILLVGAITGRVMVRPAQRDGILLAVLVTYTLMSLVFYGNPRIGLFCAPILIVYASSWFARRLRFARRPDDPCGA